MIRKSRLFILLINCIARQRYKNVAIKLSLFRRSFFVFYSQATLLPYCFCFFVVKRCFVLFFGVILWGMLLATHKVNPTAYPFSNWTQTTQTVWACPAWRGICLFWGWLLALPDSISRWHPHNKASAVSTKTKHYLQMKIAFDLDNMLILNTPKITFILSSPKYSHLITSYFFNTYVFFHKTHHQPIARYKPNRPTLGRPTRLG